MELLGLLEDEELLLEELLLEKLLLEELALGWLLFAVAELLGVVAAEVSSVEV